MRSAFLLLALACRPESAPPEEVAPVAEPPAAEPPAAEPPAAEPPADAVGLGSLRPPPEGFVDLRDTLPGAFFDIRYHTADNFTGAPLPGYGAPGAWMLHEPAAALALVQADLSARGLSLLVHDAYRPVRASKAMAAWAERTGQAHLLDTGFIARRSQHNRGGTIDLSLADAQTGAPLDMGSAFDDLSAISSTWAVDGAALDNRLLLREAMSAHGFRPYSKEWWHFTFPLAESFRYRDVPYACFEADEGGWAAPAGWNEPGYEPPARWTPAPCPAAPAP